MSASARFALRVALAAALAGLAALKSSIGDGLDAAEVVDVVTAVLVAASAWVVVGAAVPQVEPHIGNKLPDDSDDVLPPLDEEEFEGGPEGPGGA